jgi:predicted GH43/DUF377 family glycosyl hydrolase
MAMAKIIKKIKKNTTKAILKKKKVVNKPKPKIKPKIESKIKLKPKVISKSKINLKTKTKLKVKKVLVKKTKKVLKKKNKVEVRHKRGKHELERFVGNPIIFPAGGTYWESRATFNPTAFVNDGKVHVLYRAVGINDISTIGYAVSDDGYYLSGRTFKPVFVHRNFPTKYTDPVSYSSGGGWNGGAEDPRVTKIGDMLYMTYTAFDGWGSVRIGLTSITLKDFLNKNWNWRNSVLISPPGQVHKNWVLFPEKIKGKFAIMHSISPEIMIEYVDDMNKFDGNTFIKSIHQDHPLWGKREKGMRGIGGAPIKTKHGWLIFYHAMEAHETHRYKLWAMLLDLKDPTKVLYRSQKPILEPDAFYENEGHKSGVVYSCGAIIKEGTLFIYYGGADMVSCVATANLELFLKELMTGKITKLKKGKK